MNKLVIKLKQHTPLIHFQWEQEEVTLRATEVKPLLDKYIIDKIQKDENLKKTYKSFLIRQDPPVLNYKMRIKLERYLTLPFPVTSEIQNILDSKGVTCSPLKWYCDCLVESTGKDKLEEAGIFCQDADSAVRYKILNNNLTDILKRLSIDFFELSGNLYIKDYKNIERIIGASKDFQEYILVTNKEGKEIIEKNKIKHETLRGNYLVCKKNLDRLGIKENSLEKPEIYFQRKESDKIDLSKKLSEFEIEYGYFTQEDKLMVLVKDEKKFEALEDKLTQTMGLKGIFQDCSEKYLYLSGLTAEQRDILEKEKIPFILLKDRCKYIINTYFPEEIEEELKKANINYTWENINEEYLIGVNLNAVKEKLEANAVSFLSSTPYFAQENVNIGSKDKAIIAKNDRGVYCFNWARWRKSDVKMITNKGILYPGNILIEILCSDEKLSETLKENIPGFFICHNFGTRQNKGFGSFEVVKIGNKNEEENRNIEEIFKENFTFVYKRKIKEKYSDDLKEVFQIIQEDYKWIKSGIYKPYKKSKLFLYDIKEEPGKSEKNRWEKRQLKKWIKEKLDHIDIGGSRFYLKSEKISKKIVDKVPWKCNAPIWGLKDEDQNWKDPENYNYYYLRSVLGIAEQYEFLVNNVNRENRAQYKVLAKIQHKNIERYASPLLFKVIGENIYLVGKDINEKMLNEEFTFDLKLVETRSKESVHLGKYTLKTPPAFSLPKFIQFVMKEPEFNTNYTLLK